MKAARSIDRETATYPWAAVINARMRNIENESHYTHAQRTQCIRMYDALESVYSCRGIHLNYRKRFVAIKIDNVNTFDRKALRLLEASWGSDVEKIVTAQGIIYRVCFTKG
jgi:hypothetical protein